MDGNSGFLTYVDYFDTEFIPSHDGVFLYYNIPSEGIYQMTFAQPIPEFETIAGMILVITLIPILLLIKFNKFRSLELIHKI